MAIRAFQDADWSEWLRMSQALFPNATADDLAGGMRQFRLRSRRDAEVFVVDRGDGRLAGFLEVGTRSYADGCDTSPVAYLEAWYIDPDVRRHGHGRALVAAAENWARMHGYREMASDTQLGNVVSQAAFKFVTSCVTSTLRSISTSSSSAFSSKCIQRRRSRC